MFTKIDIKKAVLEVRKICSCEGCNPKEVNKILEEMGFPSQKMFEELLDKKLIRYDLSSQTVRPTKKGWLM